MNRLLEVHFSGWTATPRMPFILSGNAVCMPAPSYSSLLGLIGCCLGRLVHPNEIKIGYRYSFDSVAKDLETRQRLEFDGKKVKNHTKGTDAYLREFHTLPKLTVWLDRIDWEPFFQHPVGTPSLGRSQDILKLESVRQVKVIPVSETQLSGCMVPYHIGLKIGGQLLQMAEAYQENDEVGGGRVATNTRIFLAIPHDNATNVSMESLFQPEDAGTSGFYLHQFTE